MGSGMGSGITKPPTGSGMQAPLPPPGTVGSLIAPLSSPPPPPTTTFNTPQLSVTTSAPTKAVSDKYSGSITNATGIGDFNLYSIHKEISNKYNLIQKNKLSTDVTLAKYIDSDAQTKIDYLFEEVAAYISQNFDIGQITNMPEGENKQSITQLIYTSHDEVNILYYIYYTFPSIVISSNAVIDSDSANAYSTMQDDVVGGSVSMIMNQLSLFPSVLNRINTLSTNLQASATSLSTSSNPTDASKFITTLNQYVKLSDSQVASSKKFMTNLTSLKTGGSGSGANSKIINNLNAQILFLQSMTSTIEAVQNTLTGVNNLNPIIMSTLTNRINNYNQELLAVKNKLMSYQSEGFESYGNPYEPPSPSLSQAKEFRFEKGSFVNDVFSNIKFW